jgi:predicted AAA+ superfamily ATPase
MGMFTYFSREQVNNLVVKNNRDKLRGIFFENYVATELTRCNIKLFYWKGKRQAEMEFLIRGREDVVIPIDVKANKGNLKSITEFMNMNKMEYAVKISQNNLGFSNRIKTIPLYMTFMFLKEFNKNKY